MTRGQLLNGAAIGAALIAVAAAAGEVLRDRRDYHRAQDRCLAAAYPEARVDSQGRAYCVRRVGDLVLPLDREP